MAVDCIFAAVRSRREIFAQRKLKLREQKLAAAAAAAAGVPANSVRFGDAGAGQSVDSRDGDDE